MEKNNSDNLSKGDIISFVALILLGVTVFFGANFRTLGDKVPSFVIAILLVVVMTVFVFLAAYAKAQNRNQSVWKRVEYAMLGLYFIALIPSYLYSAKFFDIYFGKTEITQQVRAELESINKMFSDYNRKCESRCSTYQTTLEAMMTSDQGRQKIAKLLDMKPENVTKANVKQVSESFMNTLKGGEYKALVSEKNDLEKKIQTHFKNWNILFIPQYASELGAAKDRYATQLKAIYDKYRNDIDKERKIPEFDVAAYTSKNSIQSKFSDSPGFSIMGLLAILLLGGLGLVKYLLGEKRTVIEFKEGDSSVIITDGGFTI